MAKITLGKRPKSFKRTLSFAMPNGETGTMEVHFVYRTRTEYAKWSDDFQAEQRAAADKKADALRAAVKDGDTVPDLTQLDLIAHQNAVQAKYLLGAIEGWSLDEPFNEENVAQLVDELPAAVVAIMGDYRAAITEGRLGN